jgi:hypothetical protein
VVGRSSGVWWEIRTTLELAAPERILFYFPFAEPVAAHRGLGPLLRMRWLSAAAYRDMTHERDERFAVFQKEIGPAVARTLPATLGSCQFIDFVEDGRPRSLATVRPSSLDSLLQLSLANRSIGIHFERTLEPFLTKVSAWGAAQRA